jgi:hypothetical protein
VDVGVRVGDAVNEDVGLSVGVGDVSENGAENSDVLLLMSVLVAVTCGPLTGSLNEEGNVENSLADRSTTALPCEGEIRTSMRASLAPSPQP